MRAMNISISNYPLFTTMVCQLQELTIEYTHTYTVLYLYLFCHHSIQLYEHLSPYFICLIYLRSFFLVWWSMMNFTSIFVAVFPFCALISMNLKPFILIVLCIPSDMSWYIIIYSKTVHLVSYSTLRLFRTPCLWTGRHPAFRTSIYWKLFIRFELRYATQWSHGK